MKLYTAEVDAPHAEQGTMKRTLTTFSVNELVNTIVGLANDNPNTPFTFTITATEVHE
jgi:hypothetical protein